MRAWAVAFLVIPMLSGCLSFLDDDEGPTREVSPPTDVDDASQIKVTGIRVHGDLADPREQLTIEGHDGTPLSAIIYEPLTQSATPSGGAPAWPVVVFLHGFGLTKEMWMCPPIGEPSQPEGPDSPCPFVDLLAEFAGAGFLSVAYDARGFGRSGGQATVAGPDELADLDAVIDYMQANFNTNGKVGVTGISYGGGQSLLALSLSDKITTAAAHQGWTDLYEALIPGHTPKAEWGAALLGEGTLTSGAQMHPQVYEWAANALSRQGSADTERDLDARSAMMDFPLDKPLFACMGFGDTLFTQTAQLVDAATFTRVYVHNGGHGTLDETCWDRTKSWFSFFLRGVDTKVDQWPVLETVDAAGGHTVAYTSLPDASWDQYYLRDPQLTQYAGSNTTFTIENRLVHNPFQPPSAFSDVTDTGSQAIPYSMRQDPTAVFFEGDVLEDSAVMLGSARLHLVPTSADGPWQVAAQLIHVLPDGNSRVLARAAYSNTPGDTPPIEGGVELEFSFTKATIDPGSMIVLKLGGNDLAWFAPYPTNYSVSFSGHSTLDLPFYRP